MPTTDIKLNVYRIFGLSTDTKPTGLPILSEINSHVIFEEKDTGNTYLWTSAGWDQVSIKHTGNRPNYINYVWNAGLLDYVVMTQPLISTDTLTVTGEMDLTKIGGAAVGVTNPLFVSTQKPLTPQAPAQVDVGLVSEEICAANLTRKGMIIVNTSITGYVSLGFGAAAVLKSGVYLHPGGAFWMDEYSLWTGKVYAIASEASVIVSIQDYAL